MRDQIVQSVVAERERHFDLPGAERDVQKTANDWVATICSILGEAAERSGVLPTQQDFDRAMTQAAAVCLAALEHSELMKNNSRLA